MSRNWTQPAPAVVINDETGEFVMTEKIGAVRIMYDSTKILNRDGVVLATSTLSPKEIRNRMFSLYD